MVLHGADHKLYCGWRDQNCLGGLQQFQRTRAGQIVGRDGAGRSRGRPAAAAAPPGPRRIGCWRTRRTPPGRFGMRCGAEVSRRRSRNRRTSSAGRKSRGPKGVGGPRSSTRRSTRPATPWSGRSTGSAGTGPGATRYDKRELSELALHACHDRNDRRPCWSSRARQARPRPRGRRFVT